MSPAGLTQILEPAARPHAALALEARLDLLRARLRALGRVVVAYSGGVDSSLVLCVARETLGDDAIGVIGRSDSYAGQELERALAQAGRIGAHVEIVPTGELSNAAFASNPADRCYHCKRELYRQLSRVAADFGGAAIVDGTMHDDLGDWRPGRRAAEEANVRSPLLECGFTKTDVRAAAERLGLPSHDKPASPCLASRIPYGTVITRANLSQVERGEALLHMEGFHECRLRHHGETARIEVPGSDLARMVEEGLRRRLVDGLRAIGYKYVALDLEGFRSGALNRSLEARAPGVGNRFEDIPGTDSGLAR